MHRSPFDFMLTFLLYQLHIILIVYLNIFFIQIVPYPTLNRL